MNIFKQFGMKEVANVTLYSIHSQKDGSGNVYYVPALHFDTLKISGFDKTADGVWTEGGIGNNRLIHWDYGKKIDVKLEDALCTPAGLSLCWGGILSANWKNGEVDIESSISINKSNFKRLSRFDKTIYVDANLEHTTIRQMLPNIKDIKINGFGMVGNKTYNWKANVNVGALSISVIPNRFFDVTGRSYPINQNQILNVTTLPTYLNLKNAVIYEINNSFLSKKTVLNFQIINSFANTLIGENNKAQKENIDIDTMGYVYNDSIQDICAGDYLAIFVDNDNNYHTLIGNKSNQGIVWAKPSKSIVTSQFENISMYLKFQNLNTMIYYVLTKYQDNIELTDNSYWCYISKEMLPYDDDYWFEQGDVYYIKHLSLSKERDFKGRQITIKGQQFPGLYMLEGETFIKERGTDKEEHMQIKIPMCVVKSDNSITLEADGEPVVMTLDLEVGCPKNGIMMELTAYEVAQKLYQSEKGVFYAVDGSTDVLSE